MCSTCLREVYCSSDCQKRDWRAHKSICKTLKKLSNQFLPYREAIRVMIGIISEKIGKNIRVIEHVISFAKFQFGNRVTSKSYRERENGERLSNWDAEIFLFRIYSHIVFLYGSDQSLSLIIQNNMTAPYLEKMLEILRPWSALIDSDDTSRVDSISIDQVNEVLYLSSSTEGSMAHVCVHRKNFNPAESHCQRALSYARQYQGDEKNDLLFKSLLFHCDLRRKQQNYKDAVTFAEEAYNCVAIAYNPVHPDVQYAATNLIGCLIHTGDFYDAERYAQATLDSLRDPANGLDQESEAVASGYCILGKVINNQFGDLVKAEALAREAYRIRVQLYGNDHFLVGLTGSNLANILMSQRKLGDETQKLYERSLAISITNEGPEAFNAGVENFNLGNFHQLLAKRQMTSDTRKQHLCLAKSYSTEADRISTKIYGSSNPHSIRYASQLSTITLELSEA